MPIMRNPFRKQDDNAAARPATAVDGAGEPQPNGIKPIDIKEKEKEPVEYQLSEISDSGVYLPPSPPERRSFWSSSSRSRASSGHRSAVNENEPFSISRESFECYRRSFDISARSPIVYPAGSDAGRTRASLDNRVFLHPPPPRTSHSFTRASQVPAETTEEEDKFEDVDIADKPAAAPPPPSKRRGLLSRITDSGSADRPASADGKSGSSWHLPGRRRGQSGQGSELGAIPKREAATATATTTTTTTATATPQPPPQSQQARERPPSSSSAAAAAAKPSAPKAPDAVRQVADGVQSVDLNADAPKNAEPKNAVASTPAAAAKADS